jgi:hypothetical protein
MAGARFPQRRYPAGRWMMQVSARNRNEYSLLLISPPAGTSLRGTAKVMAAELLGKRPDHVRRSVVRRSGVECYWPISYPCNEANGDAVVYLSSSKAR